MLPRTPNTTGIVSRVLHLSPSGIAPRLLALAILGLSGFLPEAQAAPPPVPTFDLTATDNVPNGVFSAGRWEKGFRDGGTLDFSPEMAVIREDFNELDSISMEVLSPNSVEYVDYVLQPGEKGSDWKNANCHYISFWYQASDLEGELMFRLNQGKRRSNQTGGKTWGASFAVKPGTGWKKVTLPFSAFTRMEPPSSMNDARQTGDFSVLTDNSSAELANIATIAIGSENNHLMNTGTIKFAEFKVGQFNMEYMAPPAAFTELMIMKTGLPATARVPSEFEMGAKPEGTYNLQFKFGGQNASANLAASFRVVDAFHREIKSGSTQLVWNNGGFWSLDVPLNTVQSTQLYYSEYFSAQVVIQNLAYNAREVPANGAAWAVQKLKYQQRDDYVTPPLASSFEQTAFGNLRLVDRILCKQVPHSTQSPNPYKKGGWRDSWVKSIAYSSWVEGVVINTLNSVQYREATNNQFFGYRVGRGQMTPGAAYLLRVKYAEDKSRYVVMDIKAGRNSQSIGFRTGVPNSPNHPGYDYPLAGDYDWYDTVVVLDDAGYGYAGSHSTDATKGFWVFFHDIGRCYAGLYEGGPAIAEIKLYELGSDSANYPAINYPAGAKKRIFMTDWERQPEALSEDISHWGRLVGLNAISPVIQKWSFTGFWHTSLGYAPATFYSVTPEGGDEDLNAYSYWLEGTKERGMGLIPRIEYGGSSTLVNAAKVVNQSGATINNGIGRFATFGANIMHQATKNEFKTIVDELIGEHMTTNPQLMGLLWRQRSDRIQISYDQASIQQFCLDKGHTYPGGNAASTASWVYSNHRDAYAMWWQEKRRDFLIEMKDHLKTYNSNLALLYYNWDEDGWENFGPGAGNKGIIRKDGMSALDWHRFYNINEAALFWATGVPAPLTNVGYKNQLTTFADRHERIYPNLFGNNAADDIHVFAPVHRQFLADNPQYISYFQTKSGIAVSNMFSYEERARWNVQGDDFEAASLEPAGRFGMAHEIYSMFHGDPVVLTFATYRPGRGSASLMREFAQAFLALPNQQGVEVPNSASPANADVKVRTYVVGGATYVSVVHKGLVPAQFTISVPSGGASSVINATTNSTVASTQSGGAISWTVNSDPMKLHAFKLN